MKYYAVKKGRKTGIFTDWPSCKKAIDKYPNAVYKSFSSQAEAENFLSDQGSQSVKVDSNDQVLAYVDGSFMTANNRYGFGGILIYQGEKYTFFGGGDDPELVKMRNVAGEMMASMRAVKTAIKLEAKAVLIHFDYQGIEKWVNGDWQAKNDFTQAYRQFMLDKEKEINIQFVKVKAHSNDHYNDIADQLAKKGALN